MLYFRVYDYDLIRTHINLLTQKVNGREKMSHASHISLTLNTAQVLSDGHQPGGEVGTFLYVSPSMEVVFLAAPGMTGASTRCNSGCMHVGNDA